MLVTVFLTLLLSCGDDEDPPVPPSSPPTRTAAERMAIATSVALTRAPVYTSQDCKAARERPAGSDFVMGEFKEQGQPTWEERFLDVDVVVRAKLVSSHPRIARIRNSNDDGERYYPAIEMIFRVFEAFRGSVSLDYIVVWQVGWDYYGSYADAERRNMSVEGIGRENRRACRTVRLWDLDERDACRTVPRERLPTVRLPRT